MVLHNSFILSLLLFSLKYLGIVLVAVLTSLFIVLSSVSVIFFFSNGLTFLMVMGHCIAFLLLHYRLVRFSGSKCHTSEFLCDINFVGFSAQDLIRCQPGCFSSGVL